VFFESWSGIARVVLSGTLAYVALVVFLRISGKRTLSKMNAFDFVVTVAIGSTLATVLTSKQVPLAEGVTALALLIGLQYVVAFVSVRSPRFSRAVKSQPRVIFHDGSFARHAMREERITEEEIDAAIREASVSQIDDVESVVLESSGEISVVRRNRGRTASDAAPSRARHVDATGELSPPRRV
jgi:uncharacterized membrane protein YcaP (DUF421 family)